MVKLTGPEGEPPDVSQPALLELCHRPQLFLAIFTRQAYIAFKFSEHFERVGATRHPLFFIDRRYVSIFEDISLDINEPRLIAENGQEAQIAALIEPEIVALGFRLVRVRLTQMNGLTLQIMAERPDGSMGVHECEAVSKAISPILDIEEPVNSAYNLEVSSPGIDRPLVRVSDFETWTGHMVKLETRQIINGRKRYKGTILKVEDGQVTFRREAPGKDESENFVLAISDIAEAKLLLSDDLIREALRRDKALRKASGVPDNSDTQTTELDH